MNRLPLQTYLLLVLGTFLFFGCRQGIEPAVSYSPNDQPDEMFFRIHDPGVSLHLDTESAAQSTAKKFDIDNNGSKDILIEMSYVADSCSPLIKYSFQTEIISLKQNCFFGNSFEPGENSIQLNFGDTISILGLNSDPNPGSSFIEDHWTQDNILYADDCTVGQSVWEFQNGEYLPIKFVQQTGHHLGWIQIKQHASLLNPLDSLSMSLDLEVLGWAYNKAFYNDIFAGQTNE